MLTSNISAGTDRAQRRGTDRALAANSGRHKGSLMIIWCARRQRNLRDAQTGGLWEAYSLFSCSWEPHSICWQPVSPTSSYTDLCSHWDRMFCYTDR
ncbi:hypothetical protein XELAEV_18034342mg [Xenopus laevis]|uniref:Uncharacterized protein n=1 Tax=Xenopus laevis TaxID=8355 RepID=A0A974CDU9_XENLA|nr:hypothetical protein XELAEV_18034342mg [Xenopus laevis]